jgi:hypothetical protein
VGVRPWVAGAEREVQTLSVKLNAITEKIDDLQDLVRHKVTT